MATAIGLILWGIREERHDRTARATEIADGPVSDAVASRVAGDAPSPVG